MNINTKTFFIISFIGVILSSSVALYMSARYMGFSNNTRVVQALSPSHDKIVLKIDNLLIDHKYRDLIINELKARHEQNVSLHSVLTNMTADSKLHALWSAVLWYGIAIIFSFLTIRFQKTLKKKRK